MTQVKFLLRVGVSLDRGGRYRAMMKSDLEALRRVFVFSDLTSAALARVGEAGFVQSEPKGARVFSQGDVPKFLHVVLSGRLALVAELGDEREAVVEFFGPGEVVIAAPVLLEVPYLTSGILTEDSRLAYFPADIARELTQSDIRFSRNLALMLARHWRLLAHQIRDQKLRSAPQRLAGYLLGSARLANGRLMVELAVDKRSLASRLGMTPENLSRNLAQLAKVGVHVRGRRIEIADPEGLRAFCHDDGLA